MPALRELEIWNRALGRIGAALIEPEAEIVNTAITATSPPLVTCTQSYADGDLVLVYDQIGGDEFTGRVFEIVGRTATDFELYREDGSGFQASSGGFVRRLPDTKDVRSLYAAWPAVRDEVLGAHSWKAAERRMKLARLDSARVITGLSVRAITAIGNTTPITITAAGHGLSNGGQVWILGSLLAAINDRYWTVTGVSGNDFQLVGTTAAGAFGAGGIAARNPPLVTLSASHGLAAGAEVYVAGIVGATELNGRWFQVGSAPSSTTLALVEDGDLFSTAYASGGTLQRAMTPFRAIHTWAYRYPLPSTAADFCLAVHSTEEESQGTRELEWVMSDRDLLTDVGITCEIRYSRRVYNVDRWDPLLVSTAAARLAFEIVPEILDTPRDREQLWQSYQAHLRQARRADNRRRSPGAFRATDWELRRWNAR